MYEGGRERERERENERERERERERSKTMHWLLNHGNRVMVL